MFDVEIMNGSLAFNQEAARELTKLKEFQITLQEMKNEEEELKEAINIAFKEAGIEPQSFSVGGVEFQYKKSGFRKTVDTKRLKAEMPDLAEAYSKTTVTQPSWSIKYGD